MKPFAAPFIVHALQFFAGVSILIPVIMLVTQFRPEPYLALCFWITGIIEIALSSIVYYAARTAHYTEQMVIRQLMRERESAGQF